MARVVVREFIMLRIPWRRYILRGRYVTHPPLFSVLARNVNPVTVSFRSRNSLSSPLPLVYPPFTLADKPHRPVPPVVSRQLAEQQTTRGIFERVYFLCQVSHLIYIH